jgi:hypothetical protein
MTVFHGMMPEQLHCVRLERILRWTALIIRLIVEESNGGAHPKPEIGVALLWGSISGAVQRAASRRSHHPRPGDCGSHPAAYAQWEPGQLDALWQALGLASL